MEYNRVSEQQESSSVEDKGRTRRSSELVGRKVQMSTRDCASSRSTQ